jgi:hypothetical protein
MQTKNKVCAHKEEKGICNKKFSMFGRGCAAR